MKNGDYTRSDDYVVCPYCSYRYLPDEMEPHETELITCEDCEKEFYALMDVSVYYETWEATYGTCKKCKKESVVVEDLHSSIGSYKSLCLHCGRKERKRLERAYLEGLKTDEGL